MADGGRRFALWLVPSVSFEQPRKRTQETSYVARRGKTEGARA